MVQLFPWNAVHQALIWEPLYSLYAVEKVLTHFMLSFCDTILNSDVVVAIKITVYVFILM